MEKRTKILILLMILLLLLIEIMKTMQNQYWAPVINNPADAAGQVPGNPEPNSTADGNWI